MNNNTKNRPQLHEVAPPEVVGRDTIARYQAQFRAAAYACLEILSGKSVDRVYCDFQDDFVCRHGAAGASVYHFYQVKTKSQRNFQWSTREIFGIPKRQKPKTGKIAGSFAGKLMMHTVRFKEACGGVVFLTNVHFDNELEAVATALEEGRLTDGVLNTFMERFNDEFIEGEPLGSSEIEEMVRKLLLKPGVVYLQPHSHDFEALARNAIFKYSEIDLEYLESKEIINNLVALVERKSSSKIFSEMTAADLDDSAGIGVSDLLEILSISKGAYQELISGGDPKAIKSASIIQRKLSQAGAPESMIEYCSKWKIAWDIWFRDKRHTLPEFDLNFLQEELNGIKNGLISGQIKLGDVDKKIDRLWNKISEKGLTATLSKDLLLGGVFSALVRSEAQ